MSKYLELFKGSFNVSINEKTKPENKPYIGYSLTEGKLAYTVIPKPVVGPADNEIWYTTTDSNIVTPSEYADSAFVDSIKSNTYENGKGIITFDEPVTSIGNAAFFECSSLTSVTLPNSVESIEVTAFQYCISLTSVTIPNSVTSIGVQAFDSCESLTSIVIPNSITSIGDRAFVACYYLTSITFEGTMEEWNSTTKGIDWNSSVPATYVQCSDGQVAL